MLQKALILARVARHPIATRKMASVADITSKPGLKDFIAKAKEGAKVAIPDLRPPTPLELIQGIKDANRMIKNKNWKNITVHEAFLNACVCTEVLCWFFVGECIGKGTIIGYQV